MFQRKSQNVLMITLFVFMGLLFTVSFCFAQNGVWNLKANMPTARCFAASCELNGKIYVIGGSQSTSSRLDLMEVYDVVSDTWDITKPNMPTSRAELCVAAVNGKIYALGGATAHVGTPLGMVEEYDPLTDTWDTNKQPMPTARMGAACGVINNKIYVAGGATGSNYTPSNKLEIYDPATDTWTSGANMLAARYQPDGAILNDTLYVIGGLIGSPWTGQTAVQMYDPLNNNWTWVTSLNTGRVGHTANAVNGKIYVIGGDRQPPILMDIEQYNPQTKSWTVFDSIPTVMIIHSASVYNNQIFVFGGNTVSIPQVTVTDKVFSYAPSITSINSLQNETPGIFNLHQNYPNPFNPNTTIEFSISKTEFVTLKVYNMLGQEVATLVSKKLTAGNYTYTWDATNFASGVYIYTLETRNGYKQRKKLLLLK